MRNVTRISLCAMGSLLCAALAPAANAQLSSVTYSATSGAESLDFMGNLALPYFNLSNAHLYGADINVSEAISVNGTLSNSSTSSQTFDYSTDALTPTTGIAGSYHASLSPDPLYDNGTTTLAAGGSTTYTGTATDAKDSGLITTGLVGFQKSGDFNLHFGTTTFQNFTGSFSGVTAAQQGTGDVTTTVTYYYAPVPELTSSIGLGAMMLGGGLLGLRARRRSKK